jgi:hypothetical protein
VKASAQGGREFWEIKRAGAVLWRKPEAIPAERASTCLTAKNGVTHVDLALWRKCRRANADPAEPTVDVQFQSPRPLSEVVFEKKGRVTGARRDSKGFPEPTWLRHVDASYATTA